MAFDATKPADSQTWDLAAADIRNNFKFITTNGIPVRYLSAAPTTNPNGDALSSADNGELWMNTNNGRLSIYKSTVGWVGLANNQIDIPVSFFGVTTAGSAAANTTALQAAVDYAETIAGDSGSLVGVRLVIDIPAFSISSTITVEAEHIYFEGLVRNTKITWAGGATYMFRFTTADNTWSGLRNLRLDGNDVATCGIYFDGDISQQTWLNHLSLQKFEGFCISVDDVYGAFIDNISGVGNSYGLLELRGTSSLNNMLTVSNCNLDGPDDGKYIIYHGGIGLINLVNIRIEKAGSTSYTLVYGTAGGYPVNLVNIQFDGASTITSLVRVPSAGTTTIVNCLGVFKGSTTTITDILTDSGTATNGAAWPTGATTLTAIAQGLCEITGANGALSFCDKSGGGSGSGAIFKRADGTNQFKFSIAGSAGNERLKVEYYSGGQWNTWMIFDGTVNGSTVAGITMSPFKTGVSGGATIGQVCFPSDGTLPQFFRDASNVTKLAVSGMVSHDYGAAAADWELTTAEAYGSYFVVTNASGAVNMIFPVASVVPGKIFVVKNTSGQVLTVKVTALTGGTIASTKNAVYTFNATDCVEIIEQP